MNRKTTKKVDESTLTTLCAVCRGAFLDAKRLPGSAEPTPGSSSRMSARIARHDMGLTTTFSPLSVNQNDRKGEPT